MSWFNFSSKKRPDAQGFAPKRKGQELPQAFILEPILTPSGLLDGTDNPIDIVDIDISVDQIADIDIPEIEESFGDTSDNDLEEIAFVTSVEGEETLEEIPFVTSLDDVAESEATDEALTDETPLNESLLTGLDSSSVTFESGVFTVGQTGEVSVDFLFDGGGYEGELAVFSLEGMEEFEPGSEAFIQEAASRGLSDSELGHVVISDQTEGARFVGELGESDQNSGEYLGVKTVQMRPGDEFGFMLVPNSTVQRVFDNPDVGGAARPLFSMATANPDDGFHVGQIADVTGDGSTFVMEDLRVDTKSDGDYNDVIFQVRGATGEAALIDEVIDSGKDWRETDLGQALIDYAEPYITPDTPDDGGLLTDELVGESPTNDIPVDEGEIVTEPTTDESTDVVIDEPVNNSEIVTEPTTDSELAEPVQYEFPQENQPLVGIIDTGFSDNNPDIDYSRISLGQDRIDGDNNPLMEAGEGNEHGTHVLGIIGATQDNDIGVEGINDDAPLWVGRAVGSGKWAESLVEFVDAAQESGQPNAVVNLSMDLTQIDADGNVTTRYEFTPMERAAIEYARQNNVMLVVAAGNDGDVMSVLGQASQEFDNILTVGAAEQFDLETSVWKGADRTDYSSYGHGLDVMAYGGTADNPQLSLAEEGTSGMAGTSVATAKVTGAVSQVWAANPELSYRQVVEIIKNTATDLGSTGHDAETGAGLLNIAAAVHLAKATKPEEHITPNLLIPETWNGEGVFTAGDRAVNDNAPTLTVHNLHASPNEVISAANFFSVTHQDGNSIVQYKFYSSDQMPGSGYFTLNGVKTGVSFTINADQLKDLQFVSGSEPGKTQTFSIRASDGKVWSSAINAVVNPQTINGSIQENKQPEIIVHNRAFKPEETVPLSTLFSVNDADGDAMQIYHIYDRNHGDNSGYITLNGVKQSGSIYVNASQLKDMQFVASSEAGKTETLAIRAFDGKHWSQYSNFVANPLPINGSAATNRLPVISINNVTLSPGATVAGSSLFSVQDSDGDDIQSYYFHNRDSGSKSGYFTLNGVKQPRTLYINASQLKDLQFVAGSEPDKEQSIVISAFDGKHWSDDLVVPINSSGSAQSPTDSLSSVAKKAIDDVYQVNKNKLGQPISEPVDLGNGFLKQSFESGYITWNGQKAVPYFIGTGHQLPNIDLPETIFPIWQPTPTANIIDALDGRHTYPNMRGSSEYWVDLKGSKNVINLAARNTGLAHPDLRTTVYRDLGNGQLQQIPLTGVNPDDNYASLQDLSAGKYLIKVDVEQEKADIPYEMIVNLDQAGDSLAKARNLNREYGKIDGKRIIVSDHVGLPVGDKDLYAFTTSNFQPVLQFAVRSLYSDLNQETKNRSLDGDIKMRLLDANGKEVLSVNSVNRKPTFAAENLKPNSKYYIEVTARNGSRTNYDLVLNFEQIWAQSGRHEFKGLTGQIEYNFRVDSNATDRTLHTAVRDVRGQTIDSIHYTSKIYRKQNGQWVAVNPNSTGNSVLRYDSLRPGEYRVVMTPKPSMPSSSYTFVHNLDQAGQTRSDARNLGQIGGKRVTVNDHVGVPTGELDYYKFSTGSDPRLLQFAVRHPSGSGSLPLEGDVELILYDKNGKQLKKVNSRNRKSTYDEYELKANSEYYVRVKAKSGDSGNYHLVLNAKVKRNTGGTNPNPNYIYKEADYLNTLYQDNVGNTISSEYDWYHKNRYATDSIDGHGVDGKVYALVGGEVIEAKNGKVLPDHQKNTEAKRNKVWKYNGTVAIFNSELNKTFIYWHFAEGSVDESLKNKTIKAGSLIGVEGETGVSFGVHTHIQVHNGRVTVDMANSKAPHRTSRLHIPTVFQKAVRKGLVKLYR
ncbi:MAG: S8 family serine peptidase [Coleofasciculus chthonoplastes F3-SA18-01]|uniref:S8 family serine peptidase n=1 Tax=Coleofasciculus chthonoplastes TaxID=64178 RepID=UPI0033045737